MRQNLKDKILKIIKPIPLPKSTNSRYSVITPLPEKTQTPKQQQLIEISLNAIKEASKIDLTDVSNRMKKHLIGPINGLENTISYCLLL